jgi:hypothetical protein
MSFRTPIAVAILGTERQDPPETPAWAEEAGLEFAGQSPAGRLLHVAGVSEVARLAGFVAPSGHALPAPASPENLPAPTDPVHTQVLATILADAPLRLQAEALRLVGAHGYRLPPATLPAALAVGRRHAALRRWILPVLGQRGRWLAQFEADWSYAAGSGDSTTAPEVAWEEGSLDARALALRALRRTAPADALERLQKALPTANARERAALLATLAEQLGPSDEAFLEPLLTDRSKEVRGCAARLLARLPGSALVNRMAARLEGCLTEERKLLRRVTVLEPPAVWSEDAAGDALVKAPSTGFTGGERAWWLYQLARHVPPAWWEARLSRSPAEVVAWARSTEWQAVLLSAWADWCADGEAPAAWVDALLGTIPPEQGARMWSLISALPTDARAERCQSILARVTKSAELVHHLQQVEQILPPGAELPLSAEVVKGLLVRLRQLLGTGRQQHDYSFKPACTALALWIPARHLPLASLLPAAPPDSATPSEMEGLSEFHLLVDLRRRLHAAFPPSTAYLQQ